MSNLLISIIIPTYNEEKYIIGCLESLLNQSYQPIEIIIVDDGSRDKTISLITQFIKQLPRSQRRLKVYKQAHLGAGSARNKGAAKAKGKIFVFVDADMVFDKKFIHQLVKPIIAGKTIGTFTKDELVANNQQIWARSWSLIRGFKDGRMHPANYPDTQKVFRAILADKFRQAGGYDTKRGYDDDWTISEKLGAKATLATGAIIYHFNSDTLKELFTQAKWMGTRRYKFWVLGKFVALFRAFLPFSLIKGSYLAFKHKFIPVILAQVIFDLGLTFGILSSIIKSTKSK